MMGARCLNPTIGRMDGIDNYASALPGLTGYNWVNNNPNVFTDPDGNFTTSIYNSSTNIDLQGGSFNNGFANVRFAASAYSVDYYYFSGKSGGEYRRRASDVETGRIFNYRGDPNNVKVLYNDYWEEVSGNGPSFSQGLPGVSNIRFSSVNPQVAYWSGLFNHTNNGVGGLGTGIGRLGGSFRLTKGYDISFKHYSSGWGGGSRAGITTYNAAKWGGRLARGSFAFSVATGIYNINAANISEGRSFGYNTQVATAQTIGNLWWMGWLRTRSTSSRFF